jgi:hypothetical protein
VVSEIAKDVLFEKASSPSPPFAGLNLHHNFLPTPQLEQHADVMSNINMVASASDAVDAAGPDACKHADSDVTVTQLASRLEASAAVALPAHGGADGQLMTVAVKTSPGVGLHGGGDAQVGMDGDVKVMSHWHGVMLGCSSCWQSIRWLMVLKMRMWKNLNRLPICIMMGVNPITSGSRLIPL